MELRFTLNSRIDKDANVSIQIVQLVNDEAEAGEAGLEARKMVDAYIAGYSRES